MIKVDINFVPSTVPNEAFNLQYLLNGEWRTFHKVTDNIAHKVEVNLKKPQLIDRVRLLAIDGQEMQLNEVQLWGQNMRIQAGWRISRYS